MFHGLQLSLSDIKIVFAMDQKLSSWFCQKASRQYLVIGKFSISQSISLPTGFLLMFGSDPEQKHKSAQNYIQNTTSWLWAGVGLNKNMRKGIDETEKREIKTCSIYATHRRAKRKTAIDFSKERLILVHKCFFLWLWWQHHKTCMQHTERKRPVSREAHHAFLPPVVHCTEEKSETARERIRA